MSKGFVIRPVATPPVLHFPHIVRERPSLLIGDGCPSVSPMTLNTLTNRNDHFLSKKREETDTLGWAAFAMPYECEGLPYSLAVSTKRLLASEKSVAVLAWLSSYRGCKAAVTPFTDQCQLGLCWRWIAPKQGSCGRQEMAHQLETLQLHKK